MMLKRNGEGVILAFYLKENFRFLIIKFDDNCFTDFKTLR